MKLLALTLIAILALVAVSVTPSVSAAEPIITETKSSIRVSMSDIMDDLGTDFKYIVKMSTGCNSPDSRDLYITDWLDTSIQSEMYVSSSGFKKGGDYSVTYKIQKPIGENRYFPITCIESLAVVELTRIDNPPVNDESIKNKSSSGGCSDCISPTLGKDSDGVQRVWNGVGINGHFEDGSYFYTEYPMQYTEIGKINNVILKYWENHGPYNIEVIQLGIGVNEVGSPISESQAIIEVWMDYFSNDIENPVIGTIKVVDRDGILDYVAAVPSLVNCNQSDEQTINQCLQVEFVYSYAKVPESPVLMSNAFDYKKNNINDYFNDGLTVIDPNYVEPLPETPYKYECQDRVKPSMDRNNCVFADIVKIEQDKALAVFNSTNISNSE